MKGAAPLFGDRLNLRRISAIYGTHHLDFHMRPSREEQLQLLLMCPRTMPFLAHQFVRHLHRLPFAQNPRIEVPDIVGRSALLMNTDLSKDLRMPPDLGTAGRKL